MLKVIGGEQEGEFKAVASGTLPNGKPVVVNADGTVSVVEQTTETGTETMGSETQFPTTSNGAAGYPAGAYDSVNGKVVFAYRDASNSQKGTAVVGTVSGSSVTWGTPVVFEEGRTQWISAAFDSVNGKVVISYQDIDNSFYGKTIVGTVSGSTITFGTPVVFQSSESTYMDTTYDASAGAIVVNYAENTGLGGRVIAGTVSGTSITFGSVVQFGNTGIYGRAVYHPEEQCTIIAWRDSSPVQGAARALTVSGTTITLGSKYAYQAGGQANQNDIAYDADSKKIVIIARDEVNVTYGSSYVGTVSGTTLTFASPVTFQSGSVDWMGIEGWYTGGVAMTYDNQSVSNRITFKFGTISGTTITWGTGTDLYVGTGNNGYTGWAMDTGNNRLVMVYNANNVGKYRVYNPDYTAVTKNLTAENYIGMSRGVVEQTTVAQAAGIPVTFESAIVRYTSAAYDANSQKVVISYRDQGNSDHGTAVVGTVNASDNSISFGTPVVFESASVKFTSITYDANAQKVVIAYEDEGNSQYGTAIVGTVSGTSISFGTATVFKSSAVAEITSTYDSTNNKVVIAYAVGSAQSQAIVGTVSGTSISFGTATGYESTGFADYNSIAYDANAGKVVIAYRNGGAGNLYGRAVVGTVSGTSISFGSPVTYNTAATEYMSTTYDSANQKIVIAYQNNNTSHGMGIVGTVSGTSISFGTAATFSTASSQYNVATYDANAQRIVISFRGTSLYGNIVAGQVDGTSITFNTPTVFQSSRSQDMGTAYDSNSQKVVTSFWDYAASTGDAVVLQAGYTATDRYPVADGDPARLDIIGSVSDNQLSLTAGEKYYVQTDGTISTTAGSPSVLAGTAISATKLVVKT